MIECRRYTPDFSREWDDFVVASRNSTFLFYRGYMDYHADRFTDHSLIFTKKGKTIALLPANITTDGTLHSHQGLTYGGLILPPRHINGEDVMEIMGTLIAYCRAKGFKEIIYKALPYIYSLLPAQDDLYALWRLGATTLKTELSSALIPEVNPGANADTRRRTRKAISLDPVIAETDDVDTFWHYLADTLSDRHGVKPVHTAAELRLLKDRFPDNIHLHTITLGGEWMAGVCIYDTGLVAHSQYTASTPAGRELSMVFALYSHLINNVYHSRRYFDIGISNEEGGHVLNTGLLRQKSSFGCTGVAHQTFILKL